MSQVPNREFNFEISKLPKWAQAYIAEIQRQRDTAVEKLQMFVDNQTESPIFVEELVCIESNGPVSMRRFINGTKDVTFNLEPDAKSRRENEVNVRIDHFDPTRLLVSASWNGIQIKPAASNVVEIKAAR